MPGSIELPPIRRWGVQVALAAGSLAMILQSGPSVEAKQMVPATILISDEEEPTTTTTEAPPPETTTTTTLTPEQQEAIQFQKEWDALHPQIKRILLCEAPESDPKTKKKTGRVNWQATNPESTASGGGQALNSTWRGWVRSDRYGYGTLEGARQYSRMMYAPRIMQLRMVDRVWASEKGTPWNESKYCWK